MPDTVDIIYQGRRLRADLVTQVFSEDAARLYAAELDTNGGIVPVWKAHAYTYDNSGNLSSDTVTDGTSTWVRSYGPYTPTGPANDSGWVKQ